MDWIEVTARTVDEARELALDRLGVVEDELEYEVIDEPRGGFLGFGRAEARIRARVKPLSREKPSDRRRRRRAGGTATAQARRGDGGGRHGGGARTEPARPGRGDEVARDAVSVEASTSGSASAAGGRRRRRRGGAGRARPEGSVDTGGDRAELPEPGTESGVEIETMPVEVQAERAKEFATGLVRAMGLDARVEADVDDDDVLVRIEGDGLGVLVGPRGATLHAVEELVRAVMQHISGGHSARVHVDVGGYRERRRAALAAFAEQVAAEVRETGNERALEPMSPPDRKVVHDALSEVEGVTTGSEGEEPRRRVVIRPA
jgi:spoIIIJ-associated protein